MQAKVRDAEKAAEWARCEREDEGAAAAKERRDLADRAAEAEASLSRLKVHRCLACCLAARYAQLNWKRSSIRCG